MYTFDPPRRRTLVTVEDNGFYLQEWTFGEHSGTHIDAPGHFIAGGRFSPELSPAELVAPLVVIDISTKATVDPDAAVTRQDVMSFERGHGHVQGRSLPCIPGGSRG